MSKSEFGQDLKLNVNSDNSGNFVTDLVISRTGDLETVQDRDNVIQAIHNRLATSRGELAELGHPEYGSVLDTVIGEPNTSDTHRVIESLVRDCLADEPRIKNILNIYVRAKKNELSTVEIFVYLKLRGDPAHLELVLPFYLEGKL